MYSEAKKLHLIKELLWVSKDKDLDEIENTLENSKQLTILKKRSFTNFAGAISTKDLDQMEIDIKVGCKQISKDDWE